MFSVRTFVVFAVLCAVAAVGQDHLAVDIAGTPDDMAALALLLRSPSCTLRLVTVNGVVGATLSAALLNTKRMLTMAGRADIPVRAGASRAWRNRRNAAGVGNCSQWSTLAPARPEKIASAASFIGGPDGWGSGHNRFGLDTLYGMADALPAVAPAARWSVDEEDASAALLALLRSPSVQRLKILCLSGLTNLADFLKLATIAELQKVESVHIVGGALKTDFGNLDQWPGRTAIGVNVNTKAEWSFFSDPEASDYVLKFSNLIRHVYTLDCTNSLRTKLTSPRWIHVTTDAPAAAAKLRAQAKSTGTQMLNADADLVEFIGAIWEITGDAVAARVAAFQGDYWPAGPFVAMAVIEPTVKSTIGPAFAVPRILQVGGDGVMSEVDNSDGHIVNTVPVQSYVYTDAPSETAPFWAAVDSILKFNA